MKQRIHQLLIKNQTEEALELLLDAAQGRDYQDLLIVQARFEKLKRENRLYLNSTDDATQAFNQLNDSLLQMTEEIFGKSPRERKPTMPASESSSKWWLGVLVAVLIGGLAFLGGKGQLSAWLSNNTKTLSFVVVGKQCNGTVLPLQSGQITLIHGEDQLTESISENGKAVFPTIPNTFFAANSRTEIRFQYPGQAYRMKKRTVLFQFPSEGKVELEVEQACIQEVIGIVKDSLTQKTLAEVKLQLQGTSIQTDPGGLFKLVLPNSQRLPLAKFSAQRKGYKTWERTLSWELAEQEVVVLMQALPLKPVAESVRSEVHTTNEQILAKIKKLKKALETLEEDHRSQKVTNKDYVNKSSTLKLKIKKLEGQLK